MTTDARNHMGRTATEQKAYEVNQARWDRWFEQRRARDEAYFARQSSARFWGEW